MLEDDDICTTYVPLPKPESQESVKAQPARATQPAQPAAPAKQSVEPTRQPAEPARQPVRQPAKPAAPAEAVPPPERTPTQPITVFSRLAEKARAQADFAEDLNPSMTWQQFVDLIRPLPSNLGQEKAGNNPRGMYFPRTGTSLTISEAYGCMDNPCKLIVTLDGADMTSTTGWNRRAPTVEDILVSLSRKNQGQIKFVLFRSKNGRIEVREAVVIEKPRHEKIMRGQLRSQSQSIKALRDPSIVSALLREAQPVPIIRAQEVASLPPEEKHKKPALPLAEQNRRREDWRKQMAKRGLIRNPKAGSGSYRKELERLRKQQEKRHK